MVRSKRWGGRYFRWARGESCAKKGGVSWDFRTQVAKPGFIREGRGWFGCLLSLGKEGGEQGDLL